MQSETGRAKLSEQTACLIISHLNCHASLHNLQRVNCICTVVKLTLKHTTYVHRPCLPTVAKKSLVKWCY